MIISVYEIRLLVNMVSALLWLFLAIGADFYVAAEDDYTTKLEEKLGKILLKLNILPFCISVALKYLKYYLQQYFDNDSLETRKLKCRNQFCFDNKQKYVT